MLPPSEEGQLARRNSLRHCTRADGECCCLRRVRGGVGNRQKHNRRIRLLMDTRQIERVLALDSITKNIVRNVVAKDELPTKIGACRTAFVCNTHDADKHTQHWIVLYIHGDLGEYFDSCSLTPLHTTFRKFLNDHCVEWTYNNKTLQSPLSNACGQYCIAFFPFVNLFGR